MLFSSSGFRPTFWSTSRTRDLKISTARGERSSLMRILGFMVCSCLFREKEMANIRWTDGKSLRRRFQFGADDGMGPVDPLRQRGDVARFGSGTTPDTQARRRVAVGVDVISNAFFF